MKYDAIIIGAGLGGLTTAATLAKKGKKVIILEQHFIVGGCATVFERHGIRFEVGLHEMDWGKSGKNMKEIIFKKLGILKTLPMIKLPEAWRIKTESTEYTIPEGRENVINYLKKKFPEESNGIGKYFADLDFTTRAAEILPSDMNPIQFLFYPIMRLPVVLRNMFAQSNTGAKLDKYFKSDKIKNILDINLAYYSDDPYSLSWFYHASAQNAYYNSSMFIKGGSQILSNQLLDVTLKNNGEVKYYADVKKIELEGNKAVGVTYQDRKTKEMITLYGKTIIANCSPDDVFSGNMVDAKFREPSVENLEHESSLYSIYIIFKKKISSIYPNMAYSTFITVDDELNAPLTQIGKTYKETPVEKRPFVFVDYSTIDAGLVPEGDERGFGVCCSISHLHEWESLSKEEYKAKKELLAQSVFDKLESHYPGIKEYIDYYETSTPKTIKRYTKTPGGTAYGYKQSKYLVKSRAPRRATQIKNLHFTGAWGFPGGGFTGAIISGYYAAVDLLMPMPIRIAVGTFLSAASCIIIIELIIKVLLK